MMDGPPVCAISASSDAHVVGLGVDGQIFIWGLRHGEPIARLIGLPPISPFALVRLTPWQTQGRLMLAYPADDGRLAIIQSDPPAVHIREAHQGRWYGAFTAGDRLVTLGYDDAGVRFWQWTDDGPVCSDILPGFAAVISAEYVPASDPPTGVAVLGPGIATTFNVTANGLQAADPIPGENYRVVAVPGELLLQRNELRRRQERAEELQQSIAAAIDDDEAIDYGRSLAELEALGGVAESLVLQAHRAMQTGDQLAELSAWHRLANEHSEVYRALLPAHVERYFDLLHRFGQIEHALVAAEGLGEVEPDTALSSAVQGLHIAAAALRAERTVVHALSDDRPDLEEALRASQILGCRPAGSWELRRSTEAMLPQVELRPEQLLEALQTSNAGYLGQRLHATAEPVVWKHDDTVEEHKAVLLRLLDGAAGPTLRVALRLVTRPAGTVLTRSILVDLDSRGPTAEIGQDHASLIRLASQLQATPTCRALLAPINAWLAMTLQRLQGKYVAASLQASGGVS